MTKETTYATMLIPMHERTVAKLFSLRAYPDEALADVAERHISTPIQPPDQTSETHSKKPSCLATDVVRAKHNAEILGHRITASTLGELIAAVVDCVAELDSSILERLARDKARTRRYVARAQADIHPGRPDLSTLKTRSGWWVSSNVGTEDVKRFLEALCAAASLKVGADIRFPVA